MLERLVARAVPYLPSDRLIEAIGNLEQRDELTWLREEALAEVDRCLANPAAIEAFEHPAASAIATLILARACRTRRHEPFPTWLVGYFRRQPHVAAAAMLRAAVARRLAGPAAARSDTCSLLTQSVREAVRTARQPAALVLTAPVDERNEELTRPLVQALADLGLSPIWVRLGLRVRATTARSSDSVTLVDAPLTGIAESGDRSPDVHSLDHLRQLAAAGDGFARPMARTIESVEPQFRLGAALGSAAAGVRVVVVTTEKPPVARGLVIEARRSGIPAIAYLPSIELGAPAVFRYSSDRVLVANRWMTERLAAAGVAPRRLHAVGSIEVDNVLRALSDRPPSDQFRLLFLTKWPDCATSNGAVLEAAVAACERADRPYQIRIRRHPKDRTNYSRWLSRRVSQVETAYEADLAWCDGAVTGMSNSVFHALAIGRPMVVANLNPRIDLGQRHLFSRHDLPGDVRSASTAAEVVQQVTELLAGGPRSYALTPSFVSDFYHALDGRTAERVASLAGELAATHLEAFRHA